MIGEVCVNVIGNIGRGAAAVALAMLAASCGSEEAVQPVATDTIEALEARVAGDAVMLMDRESFGDTYAKLGAGQFQNANDLMHWAAIAAVAQGNRCNRVAMVNVSDRSTRDNIVWFVDCENKERVFIEQRQAEDAKQRFDNAASKTEQG
ncbi:MAG: hypothetical protein J0L50_06190 [Sphingomonadales bacterium]|nr:hypothetical protein [Sphingomonadales bacterium]